MLFIIGLIIFLLVFFLYSACVLSSRCSRKEELYIKSLNFNDEELYFEINSYSYNNRLAILCHTEDELFSNITINLPDKSINSYDEGFIDPINKDCGLYQELINCGIVKEVIKENFQIKKRLFPYKSKEKSDNSLAGVERVELPKLVLETKILPLNYTPIGAL